MEYDAQVFKMKANKKARNVWMALSLILSLSYTSDTAKGLHTPPLLCNVYGGLLDPVFVWGGGTPSAGSKATQYYKFIVAVGYGVFLCICCLYE